MRRATLPFLVAALAAPAAAAAGRRVPPPLPASLSTSRQALRYHVERGALFRMAGVRARGGILHEKFMIVDGSGPDMPWTGGRKARDAAAADAPEALEELSSFEPAGPDASARLWDGAGRVRPDALELVEAWWARREAPPSIPLPAYRSMAASMTGRLGELTGRASDVNAYLARASAEVLEPIEREGYRDGDDGAATPEEAAPVVARFRLILGLVANESRTYAGFSRIVSYQMARLGRLAREAASSAELTAAIEKVIDDLTGLPKPPRESR